MLGKLLKHEFKETAKLLIPLDLIVLLFTGVWAVMIQIKIFDLQKFAFIEMIMSMLYICFLAALLVITAGYLASHFYKTMYADCGYLTHTLPVSSLSVLSSKTVSALCWILLAILTGMGSIFIMAASAEGLPDAQALSMLQKNITAVFGMGAAPSLCMIGLLVIMFCFNMTTMVFASFSVGQLFARKRIPAAIGAGVVFYMIQQIASAFTLTVWFGYGAVYYDNASAENLSFAASASIRGFILMESGISLCFGLIYFIICHVITKKKLNLE